MVGASESRLGGVRISAAVGPVNCESGDSGELVSSNIVPGCPRGVPPCSECSSWSARAPSWPLLGSSEGRSQSGSSHSLRGISVAGGSVSCCARSVIHRETLSTAACVAGSAGGAVSSHALSKACLLVGPGWLVEYLGISRLPIGSMGSSIRPCASLACASCGPAGATGACMRLGSGAMVSSAIWPLVTSSLPWPAAWTGACLVGPDGVGATGVLTCSRPCAPWSLAS